MSDDEENRARGVAPMSWSEVQRRDRRTNWIIGTVAVAAFIAWQVSDQAPEYTPSPPLVTPGVSCDWPNVCPEDCDLYGSEPTPGTDAWDYWRSGFASEGELVNWRLICDPNFEPPRSSGDPYGDLPSSGYGPCPAGVRTC